MKPRSLALSPTEWEAFYAKHAHRRITVREATELGWKRIDKTKGKLSAVWRHTLGWTLRHCGHPTAIRPWDLHDADQRRHLTGALGTSIGYGAAWTNLALAMHYVDLVEKR